MSEERVAMSWSHLQTITCLKAWTVLAKDMDDLPILTSQDMNVIYDFNNVGKIKLRLKTPLSMDGVGSGMRNDTLARLVGKWILEGWGMREVIIKALDWNQTNNPPMSVQEVLQTVNSICTGHLKRNPEDCSWYHRVEDKSVADTTNR